MEATYHVDSDVPAGLTADISTEGVRWVDDREAATFLVHNTWNRRMGDNQYDQTSLVYTLVAPFRNTTDDISTQSLKSFWAGQGSTGFRVLMVGEETLEVIAAAWGWPNTNKILVLPDEDLKKRWSDPEVWAILPFDELIPRWKVISLDGISPLDPSAKLEDYPLAFIYFLSGKAGSESIKNSLVDQLDLPDSNRNPAKMTRVAMSGVTALVRATAYKMVTKGLTYPARDIGDWLRTADITHINNEVSFIQRCPFPDPYSVSLRFCSDPSYIALLEDIGVDVIELTGNHMNDWIDEGIDHTLELYRERDWQYFGGGGNLVDSRLPAYFEHNGNRIAFIGCNDPGPDYAWSTENTGGAAACEDYEWIKTTIRTLFQDGYLVIATIQYHENYSYDADDPMKSQFRGLVDAGALIVQGSQAHTPKEMEFFENGFIHYGLGNLFFDQMHYTLNGKQVFATRQEFIDRYTFYDNRLISVELLTALLEDYAKPRPMTRQERLVLLEAVFTASDWNEQ